MGTVDALLYYYFLFSYIFVMSENNIIDENNKNIRSKNRNFDTISDVKRDNGKHKINIVNRVFNSCVPYT